MTVPALVLSGDADVFGGPEPLAMQIHSATLLIVRGDHLGAVREPAFTEAIVSFVTASGISFARMAMALRRSRACSA
jgi:predicted alpha/beta-hydrolase family hydrolase